MTTQAAAREIGKREWKVLFAAQLGWMLDGMDVMLYAFALTTVQREFGLTSAVAGSLASYALITSAAGGAMAGYFADRFGRARVLVWSILIYSAFTGMTATAHTLWELALWRALVGIGLGAEWSAGTVLVSETWPARYRGRAIGFVQAGWAVGYALAAVLAAVILPRYGWRYLFAIGTLPALVAIWVQRDIQEPEVWRRSQAAETRIEEHPRGTRPAAAAQAGCHRHQHLFVRPVRVLGTVHVDAGLSGESCGAGRRGTGRREIARAGSWPCRPDRFWAT